MTLTIFVAGKPIGQGAIRHSKQGFGYHANGDVLKPWRNLVRAKAQEQHPPILKDAVKMELRFVLLKPKSVKRKYPTVAPDLDHYVRAIGDALKGVCFLDDSQVCEIVTTKVYGEIEGVGIIVSPLV